MKEELLYYVELKNKVRVLVNDFYVKEKTIKDSERQLLAVSNFNLMMIAYYPILDFNNTILHFEEVKRLLFNIFDKNNDIDLFAIRLENLNFRIINVIGKEIIDVVVKEQIDYLMELNIYERYPKLSLVQKLLQMKKHKEVKKKIEKVKLYKEMIRTEIEEIYKTYPCLWLVPYFNEFMSTYA